MIEEINRIINRLKDRGDDQDATNIQELRDKYIKVRAENFARMNQPQPTIHIHLDDQPTKIYDAYECRCTRCMRGK